MQFDQLPDQGQPDADPSLRALNTALDLYCMNRPKMRQHPGGDTGSIIADSQDDFTSSSPQIRRDESTWLVILVGIIEHVMNDLFEADRIAGDPRGHLRGLSEWPRIGQNGWMPQTLWRTSLVLALFRNRDEAQSRFMQLATVRDDGRPANRTVVFRGFLADSHQITMVSDIRSAKFNELESNPWAEVCWYFSRTREQFRLGGRVAVVDVGTRDATLREARSEAWRGLTDTTRQSFTWPVPGDSREPIATFLAGCPASDSPLPSFGLLVLDTCNVDHLELDGNPQSRWISRRDGDGRWTSIEVNP